MIALPQQHTGELKMLFNLALAVLIVCLVITTQGRRVQLLTLEVSEQIIAPDCFPRKSVYIINVRLTNLKRGQRDLTWTYPALQGRGPCFHQCN
jgi:hypothetical protein